MRRILFMPFLQIPSGHHHVADSIRRQLLKSSNNYDCETVEILSHCYGKVERFISSFYLQWIHRFPKLYSDIYKLIVDTNSHQRRYYVYELIFLRQVKKLLLQIQPDVVICTHALPSYLLDRLKRKGIWSGTVINIYTDYYINDLWGTHSIDYHFVPSVHSKLQLEKKGLRPNQIFVTGIPVDPIFKTISRERKIDGKWKILISGGNMGAGSIVRLVKQLNPGGRIIYYVLCGRNNHLYEQIERLQHPLITPVPYLDSKKEMNELYDQVDAIITKPGGVTVTECVWKRIPIFVYEALPGQEEFNFSYLSSQQLITPLNNWYVSKNLERLILRRLMHDVPVVRQRMEAFSDSLDHKDTVELIENICMR